MDAEASNILEYHSTAKASQRALSSRNEATKADLQEMSSRPTDPSNDAEMLSNPLPTPQDEAQIQKHCEANLTSEVRPPRISVQTMIARVIRKYFVARLAVLFLFIGFPISVVNAWDHDLVSQLGWSGVWSELACWIFLYLSTTGLVAVSLRRIRKALGEEEANSYISKDEGDVEAGGGNEVGTSHP